MTSLTGAGGTIVSGLVTSAVQAPPVVAVRVAAASPAAAKACDALAPLAVAASENFHEYVTVLPAGRLGAEPRNAIGAAMMPPAAEAIAGAGTVPACPPSS